MAEANQNPESNFIPKIIDTVNDVPGVVASAVVRALQAEKLGDTESLNTSSYRIRGFPSEQSNQIERYQSLSRDRMRSLDEMQSAIEREIREELGSTVMSLAVSLELDDAAAAAIGLDPRSIGVSSRDARDLQILGMAKKAFERTQAQPPKSQLEITNKKAQAYRRKRMRTGAMGELLDRIKTDTPLKATLKPFIAMKDRLSEDTVSRPKSYVERETHRDLIGLIGGMMSAGPETRAMFMDALDETARADSDRLKAEAFEVNEQAHYDVLVVGAGTQGSVFASAYRAASPDTRIVSIENGDKLGGQFRSHGSRPVFSINSRNFRPQNNTILERPGLDGNLNTMGKTAPVQVTDFSMETYPTNVELGDSSAINQFLSAETMLQTEVLGVYGTGADKPKNVVIRDAKTEQVTIVTANEVVLASGAGTRRQFERETERLADVWSAEDLFAHFGDASNEFPMERFRGKRVAIIGGGDTGRVCAELLTRLAPKEAYGRSVVQLGGPEMIDWHGVDFSNRDEFCDKNRPRYNRLASFIATSAFGFDGLIRPVAQRVTDVSGIAERDGVGIEGETGSIDLYDIVIDATSLEDSTASVLSGVEAKSAVPMLDRRNRQIGRRTRDGIVLAGPAAKTELTREERQTFASGIVENTLSLWANTPRVEALANYLATDADKR